MYPSSVRQKYRDFKMMRARCMNSLKDIDKSLVRCNPPTDFGISTMNVLVRLSLDRVKLVAVKEMLNDPESKAIIEKEIFKTTVTLQDDHQFHNSTIIKYNFDGISIAVKLFRNCTMQVSGCRDIDDALSNGQLIARFLEYMSGAKRGSYTVVDIETHMINSNFKLGIKEGAINLPQLHDYIAKNYKLFQRIDPSTNPGLIVYKLSPVCPSAHVTIIIFSNLQVILTGWKHWEELVDAYATVHQIIDEAYDLITRGAFGFTM